MKKNYFLKVFRLALFLSFFFIVWNGNGQTGNIYSVSLDGNESFYVNDDGSDNLDLTGSYTFECWFNVDNYQAYDRIFDRRTVCAMSIIAANGTGDFALRFTERGSTNNVLRTLETDAAYDMDLDTWYHVAVTYNSSTNDAKLYINGDLAASENNSNWSLTASSTALNIGGLYNSGYSNQIDAIIDEVRVSDIARDISDIQTSLSREEYSSDANTVLLMHLNDQAAPPTYVSGTGLTGTTGDDSDFSSTDYVSPTDKLLSPDYRSKATGDWSAAGTWQYYNGSTSSWADATLIPNRYADDISILNTHTVTVNTNVIIDQTTIASGGQVTVSSGVTATINNGSGTDLDVSGTIKKSGVITLSGGPTIEIQSGGKYIHDTDAAISTATWNTGSTCEIIGVGSGTSFLEISNAGQNFYDFTWNSSTQLRNVGLQELTTIGGDFLVQNTNGYDLRLVTSTGDKTLTITGNATINGGVLELSNSSGDCYFICNSNFSQSGGTVSSPGSGTGYLRFGPLTGSGYSGTFTHSGGTFTPEDIQINSSYTLTLASNLDIGTAPLTVNGELIIPASYTLTIPAGGVATATGTLTNNAGNSGIVIESTATNQGSLIQSTASVNATVERYITGWTTNNNGWHLIASPVATFTINGSPFDPGSTDDLYRWDEPNNVWKNHKAGDPTQIVPGTGYLTAWDVTDTKDFTGALNVSDVTHTDMTADDQKWHCLGNPFASALDWSTGSWAVTDVSVPQIYDESDGNFYAVNTLSGEAANIIPSTQGFFVEVVDATNTITIPADARVHSGQDWYKNTNTLVNTIKLKLFGGNNSYCDYTLLSFNDNSTDEYDIEFDSHKLFGYYSPQIYTLSPALEEFSYNIIPTFVGEKLIPLNVVVPSEGDYTINVDLNNVLMEGDIILEDLLTNQLTNLSVANSYTFQASPQDSPNRFILHFNGTTGIDDVLDHENSVLIYSNSDQIYVKSTKDNILSGTLMVRNVIGQTVQNQELNGTSLQRISTNLNTGIYLVDIVLENGQMISKKVFIK